MNIFVEPDYRKIITELVKLRKSLGEPITLGSLAHDANMQKAHMTNVLKGRANFQSDQMYLLCRSLKLSPSESKYMSLLLELERSGVMERKASLTKEVELLQRKHLQTEMHLAPEKTDGENLGEIFPEYYLEPVHQLIHIATSIERFSKDTKILASALGISQARVSAVLSALIERGLVQKKNERYMNVRRNLHLKRTSPVYRPWRNQLAGFVATRAQAEPQDDQYGFTVVFSADEPTRKKMHAKILDLIRSFEKDVQGAQPTDVYQFAIDLIPLTRT